MLPSWEDIKSLFRKKKVVINVNEVTNSTVKVLVAETITIARPDFDITEKYFLDLLNLQFDDDIKSKHVPEIHQTTRFERENLNDILDYENAKGNIINQIEVCLEYINRFKQSNKDFYDVLKAEKITIIDNNFYLLKDIEKTLQIVTSYEKYTNNLVLIFKAKGIILSKKEECIEPEFHLIRTNFKRSEWNQFLSSEPVNHEVILFLLRHNNLIHDTYRELRHLLVNFFNTSKSRIIVGNAGSGKSHLVAHLVESICKNKEYAIYFKPKFFSGDNVNFDDKLLQGLGAPKGYILAEALSIINEFAKSKNKRCFMLIDSLNETTKSTIGFSNIWFNSLDTFINQISTFSNLYFICTLRTSYIPNIWPEKIPRTIELRGFENDKVTREACEKYFKYYKIKVTNFDKALIDSFRTPLLLDLFCKLTNKERKTEIAVTLDHRSYIEIFDNYISKLTEEVQRKLTLPMKNAIVVGFQVSSNKFIENNNATVTTDDFCSSFDKDPLIKTDNSIAMAVLEGYLIFIKDAIDGGKEIVKHTQQEVGGYLLAKKLIEDFPNVNDLVNSEAFKNKIIGGDTTLHHQLRLDILKFLIALQPEIITKLKDLDSLKLSWWFLFNGYTEHDEDGISEYLLENAKNQEIITDIIEYSLKHWLNPNSNFNFDYISKFLEKNNLWIYDLNWTYYIYKNVDFFFEFIIKRTQNIKDKPLEFHWLDSQLISRTLSTNVRELRDKATEYLIEFGKQNPLQLLELTLEASKFKDPYIYERLVSCCYGVALICQHHEKYVQESLPKIAKEFFELQFANEPNNAVYNYLVIDSIKHLLDLARLKGVFSVDSKIQDRISNYEFIPSFNWDAPTKEQNTLIKSSGHMTRPEPIGMDFGIYTIPRLINIKSNISDESAITNVYKRIFELGYKVIEYNEPNEESFKDFYCGTRLHGFDGKVDRLGKKYSWAAFFDYAGYLLLNKKLDVFDEQDTKNKFYQRLTDVDIDVSVPNLNYALNLKLYDKSLILNREENPEWIYETKIDTIQELADRDFDGEKYTMLYGFIEQRINEDHKTKSFLLAETFFIEKNKKITSLNLENTTFDWNNDIHISNEHLYNVYFGELYWADTMHKSTNYAINIPTGKTITTERVLDPIDIIREEKYLDKNPGDKVSENHIETVGFKFEPSLLEYTWETDSETFKGFSEYFPSCKMGEQLKLKSDPLTGQILDENLNVAYKCIDFNDRKTHFKNEFNYMRNDLLRKYMSDNNLALVYQIKQHSYDENSSHNRVLKFKILY